MAATACGERDARTVQRSVDRLLLLHPGHHHDHGGDGDDLGEDVGEGDSNLHKTHIETCPNLHMTHFHK